MEKGRDDHEPVVATKNVSVSPLPDDLCSRSGPQAPLLPVSLSTVGNEGTVVRGGPDV